MSCSYEYNVRLSGMDVDARGVCKASALLNHLQVAATLAAEDGGFGREVLLREHGAFWMLARSWFRLDAPLWWEDPVTIRTWHREDRAAILYRDYDIFVHGRLVGESVSGWVLADVDSHKGLRLSGIPQLAGTGGGALCKTRRLNKLHCPEQLVQVEQRLMRYSDTDINGHVNNTRYADFACDAVRLDKLEEGRFLAAMQIGYLAECRPGDQLALETGEQDGGRYVRGLDESGKSRFEAAMFFGEVLP